MKNSKNKKVNNFKKDKNFKKNLKVQLSMWEWGMV